MILPLDDARALAENTMVAVGHTPDEAAIIADHLIDCELRGLRFGGLPRALSIVERIRKADTPRRPMTVLRETLVSAAIDGGDQVGYLVGRLATDLAISKAKTTGIAVVGANETWYTGMFSYYLEKIAGAGLAGMIAGSGPPRVAPHGGTQGRFGTNPIAFGFPSNGTPIIWDIGTSTLMSGEAMLAQRLGLSLEDGRAFAHDGTPTVDPGAALAGAFAVWGGHKGSGLAMSVQLLGMMCGASAAPPIIRDCGFFLLAIDPALLTDAEDFKQRVSEYAKSLRATRPIRDGEQVRVPFERSADERRRRLAAGTIEVSGSVFHALREVCSGRSLPGSIQVS